MILVLRWWERHGRRLLLLLLRRRWHGVVRMHSGRHLLRVWLRTTLREGLLVVHRMLIIPLSTLVPLHILCRWRRRDTGG